MSRNNLWNAARLERHKAEHNVDEARAALFAAEQELRIARKHVQDEERAAYLAGEALIPWPLPSLVIGARAK